MRRFPLLLLLLLLLPLSAPAASQPAGVAGQEAYNRILKAEYELARKPKIYFVFHLAQKSAQIKSSGVVLRELTLTDYSQWGRTPPKASRVLVEKHSLFEPKRITIDPEASKKKKEGESFELKALELDDVPASFTLSFDDGTRISVQGEAKTLLGKLGQLASTAFWQLSRPLIFNWKFLSGAPYTDLLLTLPGDDARRIYWSISEGVPCLIVWPQEDD